MSYKYSKQYTPNKEIGTNKPTMIIIHHWGSDGQSFNGVVNWLCNPNAVVSAHYVVQDGYVTQLVDHRDSAWHCVGKNRVSIGIECRPEMTDGDIRTVAELIADIWKKEGKKLPLYGHKDFNATACPGRYYSQLNRLYKLAEQYYAPAPVKPTPKPVIGFTRIAGTTRYQTAIEVAKKKGTKFEAVVIARGDDFPDALSSSYLASKHNAPILLVNSEDSIIKEVCDFVKSRTNRVFIVGGMSAVPKSVETQLQGLQIERIEGKTRYLTNLELLKKASGDTLVVARGDDFPDAVSGSSTRQPIMLVGRELLAEQIEWLRNQKLKAIYVLGGTSVVPEAVEKTLKKYATVKRFQGTNRYKTALAVANEFYPKADTMIIVTGQGFADGLCGSQLAKAPMLFANGDNYGDAREYFKKHSITKAYVIGGESAVSNYTANWVLTK